MELCLMKGCGNLEDLQLQYSYLQKLVDKLLESEGTRNVNCEES